MKILHCKDLVTGCGEIFRGESEEDVLEKATEHSKNVHHLKEIPKSLRKKMHRLIVLEKTTFGTCILRTTFLMDHPHPEEQLGHVPLSPATRSPVMFRLS
jgi:predicted small metal-binding protein